jgi:hypothetical protein
MEQLNGFINKLIHKYRLKNYCLTSFLLLSSLLVFCQGPTSYWYFGDSAGVRFDNYIPTADTNSNMFAFAGCAAISSSEGELLNYASHMLAFNVLHDTLENGDNLLGTYGLYQSPIFIPNPINSSISYLITDKYYSEIIRSPNDP